MLRKVFIDSQLTRLYNNGASGKDLKNLESRAHLTKDSRIDGKQSKSDAFSSPLLSSSPRSVECDTSFKKTLDTQ
jgi:hypothetical protein